MTYLIKKFFILVHREHGALPVRSGAGCPLTPLVLAAMVRQEAKTQGPSPTPNSEEVSVIVRAKEKGREPAPLLGYQSNPLPLSAALLSHSSHAGISQQPHSESPTKQNIKTKAGSSAQHSSCSASPSGSNGFHPGQHQIFLTNVHPPIPPRD